MVIVHAWTSFLLHENKKISAHPVFMYTSSVSIDMLHFSFTSSTSLKTSTSWNQWSASIGWNAIRSWTNCIMKSHVVTKWKYLATSMEPAPAPKKSVSLSMSGFASMPAHMIYGEKHQFEFQLARRWHFNFFLKNLASVCHQKKVATTEYRQLTWLNNHLNSGMPNNKKAPIFIWNKSFWYYPINHIRTRGLIPTEGYSCRISLIL